MAPYLKLKIMFYEIDQTAKTLSINKLKNNGTRFLM